MPNIPHKNLTGANLHEPKGIETASDGDVYIADGIGGGAWVEPGGAVYGEMKVEGNTDVIAQTASGGLDTDGDYVKVDGGIWEAAETSGLTFNAGGYMEVITTGVYVLTFWASFSISAVGTNLIAFKYSNDDTNGTLDPRRLTRQSNNANDVGSVSATSIATLTVGDKISIWSVCDASASNLLILDGGLSAILLQAS